MLTTKKLNLVTSNPLVRRIDADLKWLVSYDVLSKAKRKKGGSLECLQDYLEKSCVMDTLKFMAMPLSKEEYESHVKMIVKSLKEEKMYVKFSNNVEVEQRGSYLNVEGNQMEMSRSRHCGRSADFVVYYDARSKDLEAGLEKGEGDCLGKDEVLVSPFEAKYQLGKGNVDVVPWISKTVQFEDRRGRDVKCRCYNNLRVLRSFLDAELDKKSIERDRLNGIGFVLNFVKYFRSLLVTGTDLLIEAVSL
ncbi:hypothetical protein Tco_0433228 [Tanacetum coccineum]